MKFQAVWRNGKINGLTRSWYKNGNIKYSGNEINDKKWEVWTYWNEDNSNNFSHFYIAGHLIRNKKDLEGKLPVIVQNLYKKEMTVQDDLEERGLDINKSDKKSMDYWKRTAIMYEKTRLKAGAYRDEQEKKDLQDASEFFQESIDKEKRI